MTITHIQQAIEKAVQFYTEQPEKALSQDKRAVAVIEGGLRCKVTHPDGAVLVTDMPKGVSGDETAPTPGWFLRAALASCDATVIAMRAAHLGVVLTRLEVAAESHSDSRGLIGAGSSVPAGPLGIRVRVRLAADNASPEQLREIVDWAEAHSPVGDAVRRAIPYAIDVEVGSR